MTPDEIDLVREAMVRALEYLDDRADADCVGDPPHYVPNRAMSIAQDMENALAVLR